MDAPLRVYIVAPFEPLRMGLANAVATASDMEVIGEAHSLDEMAGDDRFRAADVILVDAQAVNRADMPGLYRKIGEWLPGLKVLFLGSEEDARAIKPDDIPEYMALDTVGYLLKDGGVERLLLAIRLLVSGLFICESQVIKHILTRLSQWASYSGQEQLGQLSERETEVLAMVALGRSNREIAQDLFLSEGTVKVHVSHIMTKLSLERRTEMVRYALARGLVPLEE